ncbi:MAG TPA: hypothetical protein VFC19_35925 [Candidatus Limnocylindrales bacterium]|nr:hypothetical protein [Candidatus Limnocylindrales bacterium]
MTATRRASASGLLARSQVRPTPEVGRAVRDAAGERLRVVDVALMAPCRREGY